MKMAKADEKDINAAIKLAAILDDVDRGYYMHPESEDDDSDEPTFFDKDDLDHLRAFHDRVMACMKAAPGGLFRVVWGFDTIMHNDICDPNADTLELHPRIVQALEAFEKTPQ